MGIRHELLDNFASGGMGALQCLPWLALPQIAGAFSLTYQGHYVRHKCRLESILRITRFVLYRKIPTVNPRRTPSSDLPLPTKHIPFHKLWVLRHMARKKLAARGMRRARLLLCVFKWRRRTREARSWTLAARHGDRRLLVRTVRDWRTSCVEDMLDASDLAERGEVFFENMILSTHLRAWKRFVAPLRARRVAAEGRADSCWRTRTRESLFRRWRRNVQRGKSRRKRWVAEVLLSVLPVEFRNSARQRPRVESAVSFHRRRALRKAWWAFVSLNEEIAELQRRFGVSSRGFLGCAYNINQQISPIVGEGFTKYDFVGPTLVLTGHQLSRSQAQKGFIQYVMCC